jgi:DNA polymerase sigma
LTRDCKTLKLINVNGKKIVEELYQPLSTTMQKYYNKERVTQSDLQVVDEFISELQMMIYENSRYRVKFIKFGSLINGFGTKRSDYDLCAVHENEKGNNKVHLFLTFY